MIRGIYMEASKSRIWWKDSASGIALFLIQLGHLGNTGVGLVRPWMQWYANPIFFIISGYFLLNDKNELSASIIYSNLKKIIYITVISSAIYVIFYCIIGKYNHIQYMNTKWWIYEILTGWGICGHLWYLTAYIEVLVILLLVEKYNLYKVLYLSIPLLIILNLILGSYSIFIGINLLYI